MEINLRDPGLFAGPSYHAVFSWLRQNMPVYRHAEPGGPGFWVLTRYHDIVQVYADHQTFSSRHGMRLDSDADAVAAVSQRMLIVSDPPDHTYLKRVLAAEFSPDRIARIERLVRQVVRLVINDAAAERDIEFVEFAKRIPNHVVCSLMDIPREDWEWLGDVTTDAFDSDDEKQRSAAHSEIFLYFTDLVGSRRKRPGQDFISRILRGRLTAGTSGTRPLTDEEIIFNCNGVLAGANETTRYSTAGSMLALAQNPEQWVLLQEAGKTAVPAAVEEILRWTTPGVHALRTALSDTEISGTPIAAGDRVTLWNASANRDEAVFDRPERFDISRSPNRHVTFGHGRHLCLGARLARLELSLFLEELVNAAKHIEITGVPEYNGSNFTWGLRRLPLRLGV